MISLRFSNGKEYNLSFDQVDSWFKLKKKVEELIGWDIEKPDIEIEYFDQSFPVLINDENGYKDAINMINFQLSLKKSNDKNSGEDNENIFPVVYIKNSKDLYEDKLALTIHTFEEIKELENNRDCSLYEKSEHDEYETHNYHHSPVYNFGRSEYDKEDDKKIMRSQSENYERKNEIPEPIEFEEKIKIIEDAKDENEKEKKISDHKLAHYIERGNHLKRLSEERLRIINLLTVRNEELEGNLKATEEEVKLLEELNSIHESEKKQLQLEIIDLKKQLEQKNNL